MVVQGREPSTLQDVIGDARGCGTLLVILPLFGGDLSPISGKAGRIIPSLTVASSKDVLPSGMERHEILPCGSGLVTEHPASVTPKIRHLGKLRTYFVRLFSRPATRLRYGRLRQ